MKYLLYITILALIISCSSLQGIDFVTTKKYPQTIPNMVISFTNDTTAIVFNKDDKSIIQTLNFIREKKYFLIITSTDKENILLKLKKGDSLILYKKELIISNEHQKLIFQKAN